MADVGPLRIGVDSPTSLTEFDELFRDEAACQTFLGRIRWPDQFSCPFCGDRREPWRTSRVRRLCPGCRRRVSVTAGTIFEGTRKPLRLWLRAVWEVTESPYGTNAVEIKRILNVGSYKTAWAWLHKLRRAMAPSDYDKLSGTVDVDVFTIGGIRAKTTASVAIAVEALDGHRSFRLRHVPDLEAVTLERFVTDVVLRRAHVYTAKRIGPLRLKGHGYKHQTIRPSWPRGPLDSVRDRLCSLHPWLEHTFQGAISHEHLDYYLDEYTFRHHPRWSDSPGSRFLRLLKGAVQTPHTPTQRLFLDTGRGRRR